jgi:hypothetical protein
MNAKRAPTIDVDRLPSMIPWIEHKSARQNALMFPIVAVPLYKLIDPENGSVRYSDRESLAKQFAIDPRVRLVLSGVGRDPNLERYWATANPPELLAQLQKLDISLITTPNFSVLSDVPRTDNLHAMKRSLNAFVDMAEAGLPTALHINARTERDYQRWAEVVGERDEVQCLAVEFATGAGRGDRIKWHVRQLRELAETVNRPIRLIIRGGSRMMEDLRLSFSSVTLIDTNAFSKTRSRKKAFFTTAGNLIWQSSPTSVGEPLDDLLQHNVSTLHSHHIYLERFHSDRRIAATLGFDRSTDYRYRKSV